MTVCSYRLIIFKDSELQCMYGCLPGVTIGFDPVTYSVEEGLAVEVCTHILSGTLEIDATVTLSSSNGEAEGR